VLYFRPMGEARSSPAGFVIVAFVSALACGGQSLVHEDGDGCSGARCETSGGTAGTSGGTTGGSATGGSATGGSATGGVGTGGTTSIGGSMPNLGPPCDGASEPAPLRRLTSIDLQNTLSNAFGASLPVLGTWPTTRTRARGVVTLSELEMLLGVAEWEALVDAGTPLGRPVCAEPYISRLGSSLYRRPLLASEIASYERLCAVLTEQVRASEVVPSLVEAMLLSPYFVFRVEFGNGPSNGLSSYELAARLSYFLLRSAPPPGLLEAASAGRLDTDQGLQEQATLLLQDPNFVFGMERWITEWFGVEAFESMGASLEVPEALVSGMVGQTRSFALSMAAADGGSFVRLLTSSEARITGPLADHYGFDVRLGAEARDVIIDSERYSGILTHGTVLATYGTASARGSLVASALLCRDVLSPPAKVHTSAPAEGSARERYAAMDAACRGCHSLLDPVGFAFETYDETAHFRDASSEGVIELDGSTQAFANPMELAKLLAESSEAAQCAARRMLAYALDRDGLAAPVLEIPDGPRDPIPETVEQCLLRSFLNTGRDLRVLAVQIARSTPFRTTGFAPGRPVPSDGGNTPLEHALLETEALRIGLSRQYQVAELDAYADALRELIARDGAGGASGE
jgi:hypothetical protein